MYKISPYVKFSLNDCKGNVKQRFEFADNIMKNFSRNIMDKFNNKKEISICSVKNCLRKSLADKYIFFDIKPVSEEYQNLYEGYIERIINNEIVYKYDIEVPLSNNAMLHNNKNMITTLFHEVWHLLEMASNPKMIARYSVLDDETDFIKEKFFEKYLYNWHYPSKNELKRTGKALNKFIKIFDNQTKINILQELRRDLQQEDNAERAAFKYYTKLHSSKKKFHPLYGEKIKLLNDKLKEVLTDYRTKIHKKNLRRQKRQGINIKL